MDQTVRYLQIDKGQNLWFSETPPQNPYMSVPTWLQPICIGTELNGPRYKTKKPNYLVYDMMMLDKVTGNIRKQYRVGDLVYLADKQTSAYVSNIDHKNQTVHLLIQMP